MSSEPVFSGIVHLDGRILIPVKIEISSVPYIETNKLFADTGSPWTIIHEYKLIKDHPGHIKAGPIVGKDGTFGTVYMLLGLVFEVIIVDKAGVTKEKFDIVHGNGLEDNKFVPAIGILGMDSLDTMEVDVRKPLEQSPGLYRRDKRVQLK